MKKLLYWTTGIHLLTGGFFASLIAGLSYKEFDTIKSAIDDAREAIKIIENVTRLVAPWN